MHQIVQNLRKGDTVLEDVPTPVLRKGNVLIRTHRSLVSLGTEKMLVEFGKSSLISKARQQPEKVKQVLEKIKTDGLLPTLEAVFNKLDEPLPLGYCNAGEVIGIGEGVTDFKVGDRVASNGHHAEIVCVPQNLVAHIPDNVSYSEATFTVIGSIGLQGIRLVNPTIGETIVVTGLGLIGLITAELLLANGCNVVGFDFDQSKVDIAVKKGVKAFNPSSVDPVKTVEEITKGVGADAVIITASTKSNTVISQSAQMSRKRGRIVLVGVVGLEINRNDFYKKELSFQVSCSYGPGRYDELYEGKGIDYPVAFVRWTEKRNFETILQAISTGRLNVSSLITEQVPLDRYMEVYGKMGGGSIASILEYPAEINIAKNQTIVPTYPVSFTESRGVIGIIGAGNFTKMTMLPALKGSGAGLKYIASAGGVSATSLAKKYRIANSTTDYKNIISDPEVDLVMITTRHDHHASVVVECLQNAKNVFVEKPLAINQQQLDTVKSVYQALIKERGTAPSITVGFNRRFSPFSIKAKELFGTGGAMNIIATMNAGHIPADVWVHDMHVGGGRIIGEACHFIDLMVYLTGSRVIEVHMTALGETPAENTDNAIISLKFENGSQGVINYFSNGSKRYSKERVEIYSQGKTVIIDNFRKLTAYGCKGSMSKKQDKGHKAQFHRLVNSVKNGGEVLMKFDEIINVSQTALDAVESLRSRRIIAVQN